MYQFKPSCHLPAEATIAGVVKQVGEGVNHVKEVMKFWAWVGSWRLSRRKLWFQANACFPNTSNGLSIADLYDGLYTFVSRPKRQAKVKGTGRPLFGCSGGVVLAAVRTGKLMGAKVNMHSGDLPKKKTRLVPKYLSG